MKHRHKAHRKHHARGGKVHPNVYAGAGSNVVHEAEEKKHGGRTHKRHMHHLGKAHGGHVKHRLDRKRGGRVHRAHGGVNMTKSPFSEAGKISGGLRD